MKKLLNQLLMFAVMASVVLLTSCGDDEGDEIVPVLTVEFSGTDIDQTEFDAGEEINLTVDFVSEAELAGLSYTVTVDGTEVQTEVIDFTDIGLGTNETEGSFGFNYTVHESWQGLSGVITIEAEDKKGQKTTDNFTFDVATSPNARSYSAILLNVATEDKTSTAFFSSTDGEIYSPQQVLDAEESISPTIDFGYYYGNTNKASLASPAGFAASSVTAFAAQVEGWNAKNSISFRSTTLTNSDFIELSTYAHIDKVYDDGEEEEDVITNLSVGDVIAFETDSDKAGGSKRGVIIVSEISGTFNQGDYIKLDILVQEPAN